MAIELSVRLLAALMLFAATVGAVWADAPGRVARLSDYANEVQLANEHEDWHPIARNYVVAAGDNLWVVDGGRAELDVGGMQIWLAGGSNVYFEQFDDVSLVARLAQGAMIVRVRRMDAGDLVRVLLPQGDVSLLAPGLYVFAADAGGSATLAVRSGRAEALAAGGGRRVERGASVVLDGYGVRLDGYAPPLPPGFDAWASARDRRIASANERRVSLEFTGFDGVIDSREILIDDTTSAEIQMPDFGVAELPVGKPDEMLRRIDQRVRAVSPQSIPDRLSGERHSVVGCRLSPAKTIQDQQDDGLDSGSLGRGHGGSSGGNT